MEIIYHPAFLKHDTGMHPESAWRLRHFVDMNPVTLPDGRPWVELVHPASYVRNVEALCRFGSHLDADTVCSPGTFEAATAAVGAAILAAQTGGFALVRPPGHHAYTSRASGFCFFNNLAVAVRKLEKEGKRVFILDFDGHFGDGTASIFYQDDQVFFCSLHQYPAFPGTGWVDEIGFGKGKGFTMNIPLPPGSGDDIFMNALEMALSVLEQFDPDIIAVSAGFDAHLLDPLLELQISNNSFYKAGLLLRNTGKPLFACLEGGYHPDALHQCVMNFISGVEEQSIPFPGHKTESARIILEEYELRTQNLMHHLKTYWKFR